MLSSALAACRALRAGGAPLGALRGARHYLAPALLSALGEYGARNGHVRVPIKFVVPDAEGWAAGARGLKLGVQVSNLRTKKKNGGMPHADVAQLDALRFVWSMPEWRWQCVLQSLVAYKKLHGDLQVPKAFVVPSEAPWPKEAWEVPLRIRVNQIRSQEYYVKDEPERRAELDEMGFHW